VIHEGPYSDDFSGVCWNSQGYFMAKVAGQARKKLAVGKLIQGRDFAMLTEAHCTPGTILSYRDISGTRSWWSCGEAARAGVGIILQETFLRKFCLAEPEWLEVEAGRLARLRLKGPCGVLDLLVAYLPTGTRRRLRPRGDPHQEEKEEEIDPTLSKQRQQLVTKIRSILDPSVSLSVLAGDFNFASDHHDRYNRNTGTFTGDKDATEQAHWTRVLPQTVLHEWY